MAEIELISPTVDGKKNRLQRLGEHFLAQHKRHPALICLWAFLLPATLMALAHACIGVWPFGQMSVLTLDLNAQYVFFFEALRSFVYGDGSLLYSFSRSLGGEFPGIYAYYLASPLSYIVALFPRENITEALYFMFVLKCGLSGLTFAVFLRRKDRTGPLVTLVGATLYALIGYATVMQHNTMWFDNLILLPLIVLGLYELILYRKYKLYTLSLALAILSNFYIGYMTCLFVGLYSFFLYFSLSPIRRNPKGQKWHFVRAFAGILFFSLVAVLMAMIIIIPASYALSFGKNEFSVPDFSLRLRFDLPDLFKQFLFCSYDTVRPEGLPIVYCGIPTLLLLPCYFICRRIRLRERVSHALFALLLMFCFSVNTIDMIWHGFQMPNWLNYRYSFMLCFVLVYMACRGLSHLKAIPKSALLLSAGALLTGLCFVTYYDYKKVDPVFTVFGTALFCVLHTALLSLLAVCPKSKQSRQRCLSALLVACVSLELGLNAIYDLAYLWDDVGMATRASYTDYVAKWRPIVEQIEETDRDFYRMEKLPYRRMNDPSALGFRGLTASTSTLNADVIAFLEYMGISADSHWSEYCGSSPVTDSLLGIRYVMDDSTARRVSKTYSLCYEKDNAIVYKNPYALPIAFCVSDKVNGISFAPNDEKEPDERTHFDTTYSVFERMNLLLTAILGADETLSVYVPFLDYTSERDNLVLSSGGYYAYYYISGYTQGDKGTLTFTLQDTNGKEVYLYMPSQYMTDGNTLSVGDDYQMPWFNNSYYGTAYIGEITDGETKQVVITSTAEKGFYTVPDSTVESFFYTLDESLYREVFSSLAENGISLDAYTEDSFSGSITATEDKSTVLTTIPFDKGWKVTVDGAPVETYKTLDALMAFDLAPGTHTVEMHYMPDEYRTAARLSAIGSGIFLLCVATEFVWNCAKKRKDRKE